MHKGNNVSDCAQNQLVLPYLGLCLTESYFHYRLNNLWAKVISPIQHLNVLYSLKVNHISHQKLLYNTEIFLSTLFSTHPKLKYFLFSLSILSNITEYTKVLSYSEAIAMYLTFTAAQTTKLSLLPLQPNTYNVICFLCLVHLVSSPSAFYTGKVPSLSHYSSLIVVTITEIMPSSAEVQDLVRLCSRLFICELAPMWQQHCCASGVGCLK